MMAKKDKYGELADYSLSDKDKKSFIRSTTLENFLNDLENENNDISIQELKEASNSKEFFTLLLKASKAKEYVAVGVGGLLINNKNEILLYKRPESPDKGMWSMIGGGVAYNQNVEDALKDEFKTIAKLEVNTETFKLLRVTNHLQDKDSGEKYHYVSPAFIIPYNDKLVHLEDEISTNRFQKKREDIGEQDLFKNNKKYYLSWVKIDRVMKNHRKRDHYFTYTTIKALEKYLQYKEKITSITQQIDQI